MAEQGDDIMDMIDQKAGPWPKSVAQSIFSIANRCLETKPRHRPTMKMVRFCYYLTENRGCKSFARNCEKMVHPVTTADRRYALCLKSPLVVLSTCHNRQ